MAMSPTANLEGVHFLFTLNHLAAPEYEPGGMQVQLWDGQEFIADSVADATGSFEHVDEVVTWVQRMSLNEGTLKFQVRDGHSQTWENFGGDNFKVQQSSALESLNQYRPAVSLTESQVNYAENRVAGLVLKKLVWITEDGVVHEQNAPIPLDTSLE